MNIFLCTAWNIFIKTIICLYSPISESVQILLLAIFIIYCPFLPLYVVHQEMKDSVSKKTLYIILSFLAIMFCVLYFCMFYVAALHPLFLLGNIVTFFPILVRQLAEAIYTFFKDNIKCWKKDIVNFVKREYNNCKAKKGK